MNSRTHIRDHDLNYLPLTYNSLVPFLLTTIMIASCTSVRTRPVVPIQFKNQAGVYIPMAPIALREQLKITAFPMMQSFDAYADATGKLVLDLGAALSAKTQASALTRTTDVAVYTTVKVSDSPQVFALIGYGARASFSLQSFDGNLSYLTSSGETSRTAEAADIYQMGFQGSLASILLPDEALTAENFKKSTRTMLKALQSENVAVLPVLLGGLVYPTDNKIDPENAVSLIINSEVIKKLLFNVHDEGEFKSSIEEANVKASPEQGRT